MRIPSRTSLLKSIMAAPPSRSGASSLSLRVTPNQADLTVVSLAGARVGARPGRPHERRDRPPPRQGAAMTTTAVPAVLSHFGIHVTDLDRMQDFYTRVL